MSANQSFVVMTGTIFHDHDLVDGRCRETDRRRRTEAPSVLRWTAYCWAAFSQRRLRPSRLSHEKPAFPRRLTDLREAGTVSKPRERDARIIEFKERALSQFAAQHEKIPSASTTRRLAEQRQHPPHRQEVEDHRTMRPNDDPPAGSSPTPSRSLLRRWSGQA
ncbi:hypothetical protein [Amycolatopsis magusensis]|uniref:hypothetical protein n=1 Tax=Amycolatopsis magusensis TaxID=882444 RepID=UPI003C2CE773